MIIYQAKKSEFIQTVRSGGVDDVVHDHFVKKTGHRVSINELRSWSNSLQHVANVLDDGALPDDLSIGVEMFLPQSMKRIDVTVAGHGVDDRKRIIIVELKQWEKAEATEEDGIVISHVGGANRRLVHPCYQAWSYAAFLRNFNEAVYLDDGIDLKPCAFLHNYRRDGVLDSRHYQAYIEDAPLFTKGETAQLREFIRSHLPKGAGASVHFELENGRIRPSKELATSVTGIINGHQEFVLLDGQKTVYEACLAAGKTATPSRPKVVIVKGGPGTGKSVVALHLMAALLGAGKLAMYVSKNSAPRAVFMDKLGKTRHTKAKLASLFSGPDRFIDKASDTYDVAMIDEAHRLTEKGGLYGNLGDHLVKHIIDACTCSIFFIDEKQRVTWKDVGSVEVIKKFAAARGAEILECELASQFRCGGSDGYLSWVDNTLGIESTANLTLQDIPYDFQVFDDPAAMHAAIEARNGSNKARVVAGYCWPWSSKNDPAANDIVIGDYKRQWNLSEDQGLWIIKPDSIAQVGCIHTCQGLEVEYIGVIIGPDLVMSNGIPTADPSARDRNDKSMKGYKSHLKQDAEGAKERADAIIKNTYRTLMTRGTKGCFVYATDPKLREYLRGCAGNLSQVLSV